MKRLLIITSCLFYFIACFAGNAKTQKDSTFITHTLLVDKQKECSDTVYLSEIYTSNVKYVYGDKNSQHGGTNPDYFKKYVGDKQDSKYNDKIYVERDSIKGPYVIIKSLCKFDTITIKFPFEESTDPKPNDILFLRIILKDNSQYGKNNTTTEPEPKPIKPGLWDKIVSSYSPYWIVILIDWLALLIFFLLHTRILKAANEQSDDTIERETDNSQLEGIKKLLLKEIKDVIESQKCELVTLKKDLLSELADFKEQIQVIQNNADKTNGRPTRTIVSSQSTSGIGTNSMNELDTREVDFQNGKMVIVKNSQYRYFRIFSEKGRFYYTQNPDYGIETWASDYNNLTNAMTIKNPYDSQNSRSIKIVERGQLIKVSDDTFEIAEKLVLEFV